jgi:hypothetical protein
MPSSVVSYAPLFATHPGFGTAKGFRICRNAKRRGGSKGYERPDWQGCGRRTLNVNEARPKPERSGGYGNAGIRKTEIIAAAGSARPFYRSITSLNLFMAEIRA